MSFGLIDGAHRHANNRLGISIPRRYPFASSHTPEVLDRLFSIQTGILVCHSRHFGPDCGRVPVMVNFRSTPR